MSQKSAPTSVGSSATESPLAPIDAKTRQRLSKIDGPFLPVEGPFDSNQEAWSLRLPETIYSTVFMLPLAVDKTMWCDTSNIFTIFVAQIVTFLFTVLTQGLFLYYIYYETFYGQDDTSTSFEYTSVCYVNSGSTNEKRALLRWACIWILMLFAVRDFRDTWSIYRWIQCVPDWHPGHQKITDYCCRYSGRTSMPMQRYQDEYGVTVQKPAVGFTCCYRFTILAFVFLPKMLFTLFALVYGAGYVMAVPESTFDAYLLRVLVVIMLLHLDKLMYQVFVPDVFRHWVCNNFVITFSEEEENEAMRWLPLIVVWILTGIVTGLYYSWCEFANYFYIPLPLLGI